MLGDGVGLVGSVVTDVLYSDGIEVLPQAQGTRLTANIATRSRAADGIDVGDSSAVLRANVANDNRDLGIEAVPGVTDAGGNRATGNGNRLEFVGIACR